MYDPEEMPPPVKVVKIPRIRNGDIITVRCEDVDCERARLLGIMAITIADATNPTYLIQRFIMYNSLQNRGSDERSGIPFNPKHLVMAKDVVGRLKFIMQVLLDNDLETFVTILETLETGNSAEKMADDLFKSFINYDLVVRK